MATREALWLHLETCRVVSNRKVMPTSAMEVTVISDITELADLVLPKPQSGSPHALPKHATGLVHNKRGTNRTMCRPIRSREPARPSLQVRLILTRVKTWNGVILRRSTTFMSPRASAQSEIRANGNSGRRPSGRATFASPSSSFAARPRSE